MSSSSACCRWLWNIGALLETINFALANEVGKGSLCGPGLDERLIGIEQSAVEDALQRARTRGRPAGYADFALQMNDLLNNGPWMGALHFSPKVRWYSRVLVSVREQLAAPLDFARQQHREAIGVRLTRALQRQAPS